MKRVLLLFRLIPFALCHCLGMQESPSPRPDSLFAVDSLRIFDDSQDSAYKRDNIEILVEQLQDADELSIFDIMEQWLPLTNTSFETRSRFSQKLQPARGFTEGKYLGTSFKSYQRMKVRRGENFAAAFLMEKDAGESRLNDFFSGYVQIKNTVPSSSIVLGDYVVEAGQGISMWRGFDYRKGADVIVPVLKRNREVVPYASSDENAFLRGIATTVDFPDFSLMAFYSRKSLSALLDPDGNVTSLYTTGYFRTENEREKRENLTETLLGTRGKYHLPNGDAFGATVFAARYSRNFSLTDERFNGNTLSVFSADYLFSIRTIKFFGEWAISHNAAGGISGIHLEPDHSIDLITAYRQYPVEFFDDYSHGFAERSGTNERGWYLGVHIRPVRHVRFAGYFDQFTFPSPTQDMIFPGEGHEIFFQADVSQIRRVLMTPRYRRKVTMESHTVSYPSGRAMRIDE